MKRPRFLLPKPRFPKFTGLRRLFLVLGKNLLILCKSKWWSLLIILGPLLVIFLAGVSFDNANEYQINIAVYAPTENELTSTFIAKLNSGQFRTVLTPSESGCVNDVQMGIVHTCVVFPADLEVGSAEKDVKIFIDYSKLNLAWTVRERLFSQVEEESTRISEELTDNVLTKLLLTQDDIRQSLPVVDDIKENEKKIKKENDEAIPFFRNITSGVREDKLGRLESKLKSVDVAQQELVEQTNLALELMDEIWSKATFPEDDDTKEYGHKIEEKKEEVESKQSYIKNQFSEDYSNSIPKILEEVKGGISSINSSTNKAIGKVRNVAPLTADNQKLLENLSKAVGAIDTRLSSIQQFSAEDITAPITTTIKPLSSFNTHLNFIFPTLMAIAVMLAALLLSTIVVVMEINSPAMFRNVLSPLSPGTFFIITFLTNLVVVGLQMVLMMGIALVAFFQQVVGSIANTAVVLLVIASFFIMLGMGIGYLLKREELAILGATFTATSFLLLSNLLVPIENMPPDIFAIAQYNPFVLSVSLLRKSLLFNQPLVNLQQELFTLLGFTVALALIYYVVSKEMRKRKPWS